jgi:hypothetical protein
MDLLPLIFYIYIGDPHYLFSCLLHCPCHCLFTHALSCARCVACILDCFSCNRWSIDHQINSEAKTTTLHNSRSPPPYLPLPIPSRPCPSSLPFNLPPLDLSHRKLRRFGHVAPPPLTVRLLTRSTARMGVTARCRPSLTVRRYSGWKEQPILPTLSGT